MKLHRVKAVAWKESIQILRDTRSIVIVSLMPLILMIVFGYGVSFDIKHVRTCVFDRDNTQASQDLLRQLKASEYFEITGTAENYRELVGALDRGDCVLGVVVPTDFAAELQAGRAAQVQAVADATDGNSANVALNYIESVVGAYSRRVQVEWLRQTGRRPPDPPVTVAARTWFNEDLESAANIVPGVVAIVMAVVGTFLTSLTIAREWERGTMEQLISTPIAPLELMAGKLLPYLLVGVVDTSVCAVLGVWWFGVPFRGRVWVFFLSATLFLMAVLSLGYTISVVTKSQLAASQASLIATFLPALLLSGFIFPIDQMPGVIQAITYIVPARYFMAIIRAVFLKGTPIVLLWANVLGVTLFATALVVVATRAFHKRLE